MNWKLLSAMLAALATMTLISLWAYLVGSFCAADFDMTQWDKFGRFMLGLAGGAAAAVAGCIIFLGVLESKP